MTAVCAKLVRIRPYVASDVDALHALVMASNESLSQWLPWCRPGYSHEDARAWISHCLSMWEAKSAFPFGIFDDETDALLGGVGLSQIDRVHNMANIGYWVGTPNQGRGIAVAATMQAARFGFDEQAFTRLEIVAAAENHASRRVAEKLGAHFECLARNRILLKGVPEAAAVYSLVPGDLNEAEAS